MKTLSLRKIFIKTLALFTVIRSYNIVMLVLAQYMASLFIFNQGKSHLQILLEKNLTFIVLASALSAAAGYIINNFYDLEKDRLQRPFQHYIERFISQQFKLNTYLTLNALALIISCLVSWRVGFFFLVYQFMVWFYSHKINKIVWLNNLYTVILMVFPFFALFLYYENFDQIIFFHAAFLFLLLLITDILKDLTSTSADMIYDYQTLPVVYGERKTKQILSALMTANAALSFFMGFSSQTGYMKYFFLFTTLSLFLLQIPLFRSHSKTTYKVLYFIFKLLIAFGILNMVFIDLNPLALHKIIE
ncbi:MAG TPA: UbiA family prenyltransferase [Moheibacter sp.]|nr:UbiA family prenyltransferase [Moheibacter sp.]